MGKSKRTLSLNSTEQTSKTQDNEVVLVKINAPVQSTSVSLTTAICHFLDQGFFFDLFFLLKFHFSILGIPSLTVYEEIRLVNELINHRLGSSLTLTDGQLYFEKYVRNIASMNYNHRMLFVQCDYFYDFLLKYPQIILKHRQWFRDFQQTLMPIHSDKIQLKKWQLATLLHAHCNLEQRFH
jgi:hypothetical protein